MLKAPHLILTAGLVSLLPVSFALAAPEAAEHVAEHGSGGLPQFDVTWFPSQIFWLAIMYAILYVFFSRKTLPALSSTIENRRNQVESDMEEAERMSSEAQKVQADYEAHLASTRQQATDQALSVENEIKEKALAQAATFRERSEKEMEKLEKSLSKAKSEAMKDIESIVTQITGDVVKKLSNLDVKESEIKKVVNSVSGEITDKKAA
ncbi:MAG: hypothetical protein CL565_03730 [Alphaproteobacteria bacterium]|nr:hypothetical protein [Alphaproteobacteria bacterium]|tara:strand:+ start:205 stop:828 length:624 start_codon:yes stop_codon:yes gene_type:complete